MRFATLAEWLSFQEQLHPVGMDLTLERIALVADRLGLRDTDGPRTVIVAGTNGKGTVATRTAALLQAQGLKVGLFTSPHLLRYNERIRIDGDPLSDSALCRAFEAVDQARGDDSLTYFEFGALAAAWLFRDAGVAVQVLEVGLGGRLDAVNIWDADVAAITAVDLDHQTWLGDSREAIGREKAGVMRAGRPVVLGEPEPPASVLAHADHLGARAVRSGRDFTLTRSGAALQWVWQGQSHEWRLAGVGARIDGAALLNTATALAVVESLGRGAGLTEAVVRQALEISAPGRLQRLRGTPEWLLDVAHNLHAVGELARWLEAHPVDGPVVALVAVMADKERTAMWPLLEGLVDAWVPVPLDLPRALPAGLLADELEAAGQGPVCRVDGVDGALSEAARRAGPRGRVVVFGSFHTVAAVLEHAPALAPAALSGRVEPDRPDGEAVHAV
ncbi:MULTISPECIES: bifunctional tetrahydrofolate synthase/dihydrofolate synthase [unclassified Thioalkalivibrio]|uniref:bifunctional tetrahydrofolate synthase/dihydrofolate synthase n=1 Tax=unclassified Thioalkalivibrio TaxID=2621013 RepID=UPI000362343E|nr:MULTISPECIES: bifunctional tetrahydrofolate synthase/dihydrofolate synthase [unclassified Thioalkalivibrio]